MKNSTSGTDELASKVREMQMICEIWIAANNVKDERIHELEDEVKRLQQRVGRLSRRVSRGQQIERAPRVEQAR